MGWGCDRGVHTLNIDGRSDRVFSGLFVMNSMWVRRSSRADWRAVASAGRSGGDASKALGEGRRSRAMMIRAGMEMVVPPPVDVAAGDAAGGEAVVDGGIWGEGFGANDAVGEVRGVAGAGESGFGVGDDGAGALLCGEKLQGGVEFGEKFGVGVVRVEEGGGDFDGEHGGGPRGVIGAKIGAVVGELPCGQRCEFSRRVRIWREEDDLAGGEQIQRPGHGIFGVAFGAPLAMTGGEAVGAGEEDDDLRGFGEVGDAEAQRVVGEVGGHARHYRRE